MGGESGIGMELEDRVDLEPPSTPVLLTDGTYRVMRILTLFNTMDEDSGNYTCEVSSDIPELSLFLGDSVNFELIVLSEFAVCLYVL